MILGKTIEGWGSETGKRSSQYRERVESASRLIPFKDQGVGLLTHQSLLIFVKSRVGDGASIPGTLRSTLPARGDQSTSLGSMCPGSLKLGGSCTDGGREGGISMEAMASATRGKSFRCQRG